MYDTRIPDCGTGTFLRSRDPIGTRLPKDEGLPKAVQIRLESFDVRRLDPADQFPVGGGRRTERPAKVGREHAGRFALRPPDRIVERQAHPAAESPDIRGRPPCLRSGKIPSPPRTGSRSPGPGAGTARGSSVPCPSTEAAPGGCRNPRSRESSQPCGSFPFRNFRTRRTGEQGRSREVGGNGPAPHPAHATGAGQTGMKSRSSTTPPRRPALRKYASSAVTNTPFRRSAAAW